MGYSPYGNHTRKQFRYHNVRLYLCCVIVKRTCQYYGVDRSRHTMTFFFILEPLGVKEIFSFKNILKSIVRILILMIRNSLYFTFEQIATKRNTSFYL